MVSLLRRDFRVRSRTGYRGGGGGKVQFFSVLFRGNYARRRVRGLTSEISPKWLKR